MDNFYIIPIIELDIMVIDYLQLVLDTNNLCIVNKYYHAIINDLPIYCEYLKTYSTYHQTQYKNSERYVKLSSRLKKFIHCCVLDCCQLAKYVVRHELKRNANLVAPLSNCAGLNNVHYRTMILFAGKCVYNKNSCQRLECGHTNWEFILQCVIYYCGMWNQYNYRTVEWLMNLVIPSEDILQAAIRSGNIEYIKHCNTWVPTKKLSIYSMEKTFYKQLCLGRNDIFKYLVETSVCTDIKYWPNKYVVKLFLQACKLENYEIAELLYPYYAVNTNLERAMIATCEYRKLPMLIWLFNLKECADLHYHHEAMFRTCCYHNELELSQWLWYTSLTKSDKPIDLMVGRNFIPKMCRKRDYIIFLEWIQKLTPEN